MIDHLDTWTRAIWAIALAIKILTVGNTGIGLFPTIYNTIKLSHDLVIAGINSD
jgi:hypothetical protein